MVRNQLALLLVSLLVWSSLVWASEAPQTSERRQQTLKQQITLVPSGSVVEIKLANEHKLRGRLGAVTDSGFELQYARAGKIETETFGFDSVRSLKVVGQGWGTGKKIVVGTLIGAGVIFIIGLVACLAGGCDS